MFFGACGLLFISDMKWRYNFHENRGVEKMVRFCCCSVYKHRKTSVYNTWEQVRGKGDMKLGREGTMKGGEGGRGRGRGGKTTHGNQGKGQGGHGFGRGLERK